MPALDYSIEIEGLDKLQDGIRRAGGNADPLIHKAAVTSGVHIQARARQNAPHRTGTLQRSIQLENKPDTVKVAVHEKYGLYIEKGTGPFVIRPKNKKALFWPGADHPVKKVNHPGLKARPFFEPAIKESLPFIQRQFRAVGKTLVRIMAGRT